MVSRLNDKETGAIIAVMQRLHEDDLAGHLLRQGDWMHLNLPAIATEDQEIPLANGSTYRRKQGDLLHSERESRETLDRIKTQIGSLQFSAQYQQQPIPLEGNIIRRRWFVTYDAASRNFSSGCSNSVGNRFQLSCRSSSPDRGIFPVEVCSASLR